MNETNVYSKSLIISKVFYLAVQVLLLSIGSAGIFVLIPFYIVSYAVALLYLLFCIHDIFSNSIVSLQLGAAEGIVSIKTGISLMVSNVCSMLVLAVGRQIIDMRWGVLAFGKVSFSLTLINFALTFISQVSMVLFPALRQIEGRQLSNYYKKLSKALFAVLPIMYLCYFPGGKILELWLPEYSESIDYLAIILPICFF